MSLPRARPCANTENTKMNLKWPTPYSKVLTVWGRRKTQTECYSIPSAPRLQSRGQQTFPMKGQVITIFNFVGQTMPVVMIHICWYNTKAAQAKVNKRVWRPQDRFSSQTVFQLLGNCGLFRGGDNFLATG